MLIERIRVGAAVMTAAAVTFAAGAWAALDPARSGLSLLLVALAILFGAAAWLESGSASAKEVALVGCLGGIAAAGRVLFQAIPGVQPVTVITIAAGVALGLRAGIGVGAVAAFASNFFLGQGIWTPWQMLAWAGCGAAGALAAPLLRKRIPFAIACFLLGLAFSSFMDAWEWYSFLPHTWAALSTQVARGFPFDMAHAIGNLVLALVAGPELRRVLTRFGAQLHTEIVWS